ncbi:MAG: SUMF1/EgtB/PvdO family nonheme iron enzyme [Magnetococcales bacterium]|nr:SUMF1/EgtB/PvdO family nonheme iron enzyme [Magnetococcales bacterium]
MNVGTHLAEDRYTILKELGKGSLGAAFLARENTSGLAVVIKFVPESVSRDDRQLADLKRSFQIVHHLEHPHIAAAHVLEHDAGSDRHFLVLEYVEGPSLARILADQEESLLELPRALEICRQVALALDHAHATVLHLNLKPENVLLARDGRVKLTDFRLFPENPAGRGQTGKGDPPNPGQTYLAPERFFRFPPPGPSADRYALAVLFYRIVSGRVPFAADTFRDLMNAVCHTTPANVAALSERQNGILREAMAKDPGRRFATCQAFIEAMEGPIGRMLPRVRGRNRPFVPSPRGGSQPGSWLQRWPLPGRQVLLAASGVVLLVAAVALWSHWDPKRSEWGKWLPSWPVSSTSPTKPSAGKDEIEGETLMLKVSSRPEGASVFLDSRRVGISPLSLGGIPTGRYRLRLEKVDYDPVEVEVELTVDTEVDLALGVRRGAEATTAETDGESSDERGDGETALPPAKTGGTAPTRGKDGAGEPEEKIATTDGPGEEMAAPAGEGTRATADPTDTPEIRRLLAAAEEDLKAMRLSFPKGQNALGKYQAILRQKPGHAQATEGISRVVGHYLDLAARASEDPALATSYLDRAAAILPSDPRIADLRDHLAGRDRPGKPVDRFPEQIAELLQKARKLMARQRATRPPDDNAADTYREVLRLDPENSEAKEGLQQITKDLLELARADMAAGRLTRPENNSAAGRFRRILEWDPDNAWAKAGLEEIVGRYLTLSKEAEASDKKKAADLLALARELLPNDPRLAPPEAPQAAEKAPSEKSVGDAETPPPETDGKTLPGTEDREVASTPSATAATAEEVALTPQERKRLAVLIQSGRRKLADLRLTLPEGDSAASNFQEVLRIDPSSIEGKEGLDQVARKLLELAAADLEAGRLSAPPKRNALERLKGLLGFDPGNRDALVLMEEIVARYVAMARANPAQAAKILAKADTVIAGDERIQEAKRALGLAPPLSEGESSPAGEDSKDAPAANSPPGSTPATTELPPETKPGEEKGADSWVETKTGMAFVRLPGGCFLMGSSTGDSDEEPVHEVCLDPFWMGRHEVTQGEWEAVQGAGENGSHFRSDKRLPVDSVSWEDARGFMEKLNTATGEKFRLPTEAEWEYACRAGTGTPYHFGGVIDTGKANFNGDFALPGQKRGENRQKTTVVESFPANAFGLFDMHGNLFEWVEDWYQRDYYRNSPKKNPLSGDNASSLRVLRGGAWYSHPINARCSYRYRGRPVQRNFGNGLRLVRSAAKP